MRSRLLYLLICGAILIGCRGEVAPGGAETTAGVVQPMAYATGFTVTDYAGHTEIRVTATQPDDTDTLRYALYPRTGKPPHQQAGVIYVPVPITRVILTSTTDIPLLEAIGEEKTLVAFPQTRYIVSPRTRALIDAGQVAELGGGQELNTELLLDHAPDLLIAYSMGGDDAGFNLFKQAGIPVAFNGSWRETHPLGRAEWIKFVAAFYGKSAEASEAFERIRTNYENAADIALKASAKPKTIAGSLYKDTWFTPGGGSYMARFFADAGLDYLWADTPDASSLSLSIETVLAEATEAEVWVASVGTTDLEEVYALNPRYQLLAPAPRGRAYTSTKGKTEHGMPFYESGSLRADLVLRDMIKIAHPQLLPDHEFAFYELIR